MKHSSYMDTKGIANYYDRLGKTATADLFRDPNGLDCEVVQHGSITWIPTDFVRAFCHMMAASFQHGEERFRDVESNVVQWLPTQGDTAQGVQQSYERAQKIK